jgi:hypothetical protein
MENCWSCKFSKDGAFDGKICVLFSLPIEKINYCNLNNNGGRLNEKGKNKEGCR